MKKKIIRCRPYRVECTGSLPTSEVKRHRARLVLGRGTAWEDLRVLSAFLSETSAVLPAPTARRQLCRAANYDLMPSAGQCDIKKTCAECISPSGYLEPKWLRWHLWPPDGMAEGPGHAPRLLVMPPTWGQRTELNKVLAGGPLLGLFSVELCFLTQPWGSPQERGGPLRASGLLGPLLAPLESACFLAQPLGSPQKKPCWHPLGAAPAF